jgi:hypothetical protein
MILYVREKHQKRQAAVQNVLLAPITFAQAQEVGNSALMAVVRRNTHLNKN